MKAVAAALAVEDDEAKRHGTEAVEVSLAALRREFDLLAELLRDTERARGPVAFMRRELAQLQAALEAAVLAREGAAARKEVTAEFEVLQCEDLGHLAASAKELVLRGLGSN